MSQMTPNFPVGEFMRWSFGLGIARTQVLQELDQLQEELNMEAEAVEAIPTITKRALKQEIELMLLHYQMPGNYDHKHMEFWRGLKNGCRLP